MDGDVEMSVSREGDRLRLLSPRVGTWTTNLREGQVVGPGETAGVLFALGRAHGLIVPAGGGGRIVSNPPSMARTPVGFGDVLFELATTPAAATKEKSPAARGTDPVGLIVKSPQAGRFYRRPAANEPPFTSEGAILEEGQPVGLIEVMKTFSHVLYHASGDLPRRAKVARVIAADGADVKQGDPLLEVEPA